MGTKGPSLDLESYRRRQQLWDTLESPAIVHLVLFVGVFFAVAPLAWMLLTSLQTNAAVLSFSYIPEHLTTQSYYSALFERNYWRAVWNSIVVASVSTVVVMLLGTPAGYVFSRYRFPYDNALFIFIIFTRLFPPVGLIVPYFQILSQIGLLNTIHGIIIAHVYLWLPLVIYIMRNFFITIPQDLDEAARVDGCTKIQALWHIILPIVKPGLAAGTILTFLYSWREYLFAFVVSTDLSSWTIPVSVFLFIGDVRTLWASMAAAAIIAVIPPALMVIIFQRYIVRGLGGGIKG